MELFFKWYNLQVIESLNQQHELSFDTDDNLSKKPLVIQQREKSRLRLHPLKFFMLL